MGRTRARTARSSPSHGTDATSSFKVGGSVPDPGATRDGQPGQPRAKQSPRSQAQVNDPLDQCVLSDCALRV